MFENVKLSTVLVCVCMCACMHACVCVCVSVCMCVCIHKFTLQFTWVHVYDYVMFLVYVCVWGGGVTICVWRGFGENKVEWTGKAAINMLEALAAGKACYAMQYSLILLLV